jgi:hypothetical protein
LKIKLFSTDVLYWTVESCWAAENYPYFRRLCQIGPSKIVEPPEIGKFSYSRARQAQRSLTHFLSAHALATTAARAVESCWAAENRKKFLFPRPAGPALTHSLTFSLLMRPPLPLACAYRRPAPPTPGRRLPPPPARAGLSLVEQVVHTPLQPIKFLDALCLD